MIRARTLVGVALITCLASGSARATLVADPQPTAPCDEETVYGTVIVIDEQTGVFGLLGTRYKFQSMDVFDLELLQGRMVKIDIGADCGIIDLRVLDGDSESVT